VPGASSKRYRRKSGPIKLRMIISVRYVDFFADFEWPMAGEDLKAAVVIARFQDLPNDASALLIRNKIVGLQVTKFRHPHGDGESARRVFRRKCGRGAAQRDKGRGEIPV